MTYEEKLALAYNLNKQISVSGSKVKIDVENMILAEEIDDKDLNVLIEIFDEYSPHSVKYTKGDKVHHEGILYEVAQSHVSQSDWKPSNLPALYHRVSPVGIIPEWEQPPNEKPFMKFDRVNHDGFLWESEIDGNVWKPSEYGWKKVL